MLKPKIIAPVNSIEDIQQISLTSCKHIYAYHSVFFAEDDLQRLTDFCNLAKDNELKFLINFKEHITEDELERISRFISKIENYSIDGLLVNSLDILKLLKNNKSKLKIYADSGLNVHNYYAMNLLKSFCPIDNFNITEEVYLKNICYLKAYSNSSLSIDSNNLPWLAKELSKNNCIDYIIIKGNFDNSLTLVKGINVIEKLLDKTPRYINRKLPFKHSPYNLYYKANHFSGEFESHQDKNFKFIENIINYNWSFSKFNFSNNYLPEQNSCLPKVTLRLTSFEQIKYLNKYLKRFKQKPVYAIEFGEIVSTADLVKQDFNKIIKKAKNYCQKNNIKLQLSTPRIIIERDFDRSYEYIKKLCLDEPDPASVVINNLGYFNAFINDKDLKDIPIELGQGLYLLNSVSVECLLDKYDIYTVDFSNFKYVKNIKYCISHINKKVENKKLTVGGNIRIPSMGLCPLNKNDAILSRLSCSAPCHSNKYAIRDPFVKKQFPLTVDGFCRMHLFKAKILDLFAEIPFLRSSIGINEFVIDCSCIPPSLIPILLNRFLHSLKSDNYESDKNFSTLKYFIDWYKEELNV